MAKKCFFQSMALKGRRSDFFALKMVMEEGSVSFKWKMILPRGKKYFNKNVTNIIDQSKTKQKEIQIIL